MSINNSLLVFKNRIIHLARGGEYMYCENVYVEYKGRMFCVRVACNPDTPTEKLQKKALEIIERTFNKYEITMI
jgi:hypothetical protein